MTFHREHLIQVDRFITECHIRISSQRELITTAYESGHPTDIPESMLRVLEEHLRLLERHRELIVSRASDRKRGR